MPHFLFSISLLKRSIFSCHIDLKIKTPHWRNHTEYGKLMTPVFGAKSKVNLVIESFTTGDLCSYDFFAEEISKNPHTGDPPLLHFFGFWDTTLSGEPH